MSKRIITDMGKQLTEKYGNLTYSQSGAAGTIDCSHLVHKVLNDQGVEVEYFDTTRMANSGNYDIIDASQVMPGDVVMFTSPQNHTGIVTSYNALTKNGTFFGSQRHGPEEIYFGPGYANYKFPTPSLFLRPRKKITQVTPSIFPVKPPSPPLKWA